MIPYGRQTISQDDIDAVVEVLKSDFLTQGDVGPAFEKAVCDYTGTQYGVAVNSGTSGLHVACMALGLKSGDSLWTSPITFVASANCGLYCGANIDFVDIDKNSWNIDVDLLREKLELASHNNSLPRILVVVHLAGLPADMQQIHQLSCEYGFKVIEDASHALGATYQKKSIGNCQYSDIAVFSFHPVKPITTGEGGMAVTNDEELASKMRLFAVHGITRDASLMDKASEGDWYYQQVALGYNYRLSDIHAALGLSQLKRLDDFTLTRKQIADRYHKQLSELPLKLPTRLQDRSSAFHLYSVLLTDKAKLNRQQIFKQLRDKGIGVNVHYIPVHTQPFYRAMGFKSGDFPNSEHYYANAITLPCFPALQKNEQQYVINVLSELLV